MRTVEDLLAIARRAKRRREIMEHVELTLLWTLAFTIIGIMLVLRLKAIGAL